MARKSEQQRREVMRELAVMFVRGSVKCLEDGP